jgi:small subunit ribosomal protein S1
VVNAQVLEIDTERRRLKLGIKQLVPTGIEEYIAERQEGNVVSGRVMEISGEQARVELGEGIHGTCRIAAGSPTKLLSAKKEEKPAGSKADLGLLSSMLTARWKGGAGSGGSGSEAEAVRAGQVRSFRIARLDPATKKIELELA